MLSVPRELTEHTLNIDPKFKPVKQFLRRFNEERRKAIGEEVARLLAARFIIEVFHPKWLANPVLVLKKNGPWRVCVDYTDLNKACPADPFALPRIDQIIDAMAGCERLSFLDAYSGYHQVNMAVKDEENTAFYHSFWSLLLCVYALWAQECPGDLSSMCAELSAQSDWAQRSCLCGRHCGEAQREGNLDR